MAQLTHAQYEQLERAIVNGTRISVYRRGTEYVLVPLRLGLRDGKETIEARHTTTGDALTIRIEDVDSIEIVR